MLSAERFLEIAAVYPKLRVGVVGDFCLDRYLEIDEARAERSIETGLPVHNVVRVRAQPGGAGTIVNNLVALGIGTIHLIGFCGDDGEGYELKRALSSLRGVQLDHFLTTPLRVTFTYTKPLLVSAGQPPRELNRLDIKNHTVTPNELQQEVAARVRAVAGRVDALILLDQVDQPDTGVLAGRVLEAVADVSKQQPHLWILADSRRGLGHFPPVCSKMNRAELARLAGGPVDDVERRAQELSQRNNKHVFITLAEAGIVGADPQGGAKRVPAWPVRGEIDVVGAGDSVTANLAASLAAGADLQEVLEIASTASSIVVHQLGTTGTASCPQIAELLKTAARPQKP
jgi:rfaE bifunctional protein kinase chain/domain